MKLVDAGAPRLQLLIPHDVVGAFTPDHPPLWGWLEHTRVAGTDLYSRRGEKIVSFGRKGDTWTLTAHKTLYIMEPSITVKVAGHGAWWGKQNNGKWAGPYTLLNIADPHRNTQHFSRTKGPGGVRFVEYREDGQAWRWRSDGGWQKPIDRKPDLRIYEDWKGCTISSSQNRLAGVYEPRYAPLRRWEVAGGAQLPAHFNYPPGTTQFHAHGWAGGPALVVTAQGRSEVGADRLWNPKAMRRLPLGASIAQTLVRT